MLDLAGRPPAYKMLIMIVNLAKKNQVRLKENKINPEIIYHNSIFLRMLVHQVHESLTFFQSVLITYCPTNYR